MSDEENSPRESPNESSTGTSPMFSMSREAEGADASLFEDVVRRRRTVRVTEVEEKRGRNTERGFRTRAAVRKTGNNRTTATDRRTLLPNLGGPSDSTPSLGNSRMSLIEDLVEDAGVAETKELHFVTIGRDSEALWKVIGYSMHAVLRCPFAPWIGTVFSMNWHIWVFEGALILLSVFVVL
jgi:hypothetical protein